MAISPAAPFDVAALKRTHSLALVVSAAGVPLRPAGTGRFRARCPFHDDRVPSLLVDERDGHFFCFGCQARGDVIDFLMRHDGLDFRQAVERLSGLPFAAKAPPEHGEAHDQRHWDRLILEQQVLMNTAAAIYQHTLWHTRAALAYLRSRGLPDWLIPRRAWATPTGTRWRPGCAGAVGCGLGRSWACSRRGGRNAWPGASSCRNCAAASTSGSSAAASKRRTTGRSIWPWKGNVRSWARSAWPGGGRSSSVKEHSTS
jgi:hypothetical protein